MSLKYDSMRPPDLKVWLAHSEDEQIDAVQKYHRKRKLDPPNPLLHAMFHVVVENQVALGEETPVKATLVRLMEEGLDRNDAVHAIGSILLTHLHELSKSSEMRGDPNAPYYSGLTRLTAASWRSSGPGER